MKLIHQNNNKRFTQDTITEAADILLRFANDEYNRLASNRHINNDGNKFLEALRDEFGENIEIEKCSTGQGEKYIVGISNMDFEILDHEFNFMGKSNRGSVSINFYREFRTNEYNKIINKYFDLGKLSRENALQFILNINNKVPEAMETGGVEHTENLKKDKKIAMAKYTILTVLKSFKIEGEVKFKDDNAIYSITLPNNEEYIETIDYNDFLPAIDKIKDKVKGTK